jgi:hypothetical protein
MERALRQHEINLDDDQLEYLAALINHRKPQYRQDFPPNRQKFLAQYLEGWIGKPYPSEEA